MAGRRRPNWGTIVTLSAGGLAWQIYDIATTTEARPQALVILESLAIGLALFGLVGGAVMGAKAQAARD